MKHPTAALLFVVATATAQTEEAAPAPATPSPTGQIAFTHGGQVLLVDVATRERTVLVAENTYDRPLTWMPDGERLLYWNHDGGAWDLWSVHVASRERTNLTKDARDNRSPAPSPDGSLIAFHRGGAGVWLIAADGSNPRQVSDKGHRDAAPVWSPDLGRLAFCDLQPAGENGVRLTGFVTGLTDGPRAAARELGDFLPCFFLDAHHLACTGTIDDRDEIVVVDVRDGSRRALTRSAAREHNPRLSPDGRTIAFVAIDEGEPRLHCIDKDGTNDRDLAAMPFAYAPPTFSPDGAFVAFETGPERRKLDVFVVPTGGGDVLRITNGGGSLPVWRPRP